MYIVFMIVYTTDQCIDKSNPFETLMNKELQGLWFIMTVAQDDVCCS